MTDEPPRALVLELRRAHRRRIGWGLVYTGACGILSTVNPIAGIGMLVTGYATFVTSVALLRIDRKLGALGRMIDRGRVDDAERALDRLETDALELQQPGPSGIALHLRARIARARGDAAGALAHCDAAIERLREPGADAADYWRAQIERIELLVELGRCDEARELLARVGPAVTAMPRLRDARDAAVDRVVRCRPATRDDPGTAAP